MPPRSRTDGIGSEWLFDYDANGNQIEVDAPPVRRDPTAALHRQVTTRTFDGRDLLWTETTGAADNGGDRERTRVFEFDPNGSLRRIVNPKGVDAASGLPTFTYSADAQVSSSIDATKHATVYEYEGSDPSLLTSVRLPWGDRDGEDQKRYTQTFGHDARGRVDTIDPPRDFAEEPSPDLAARTTYTHFATGWIRTAHDHYQDFDYDYDKRGLQALWRVTDAASENSRRIDREYFPSGALKTRTGQKRIGGTEFPEYTYRYEYNLNGSLSLLRDERKDRTTTFGYDDAERLTLADEQAFNAAEQARRGKDTTLAYDRNDNLLERRTDGRVQSGGGYLGGKTTTFTYDVLDREQSMEVVAPDEDTRRTYTDYWPGGERSQRRTAREQVENDTIERWFRFSDGRLSRTDRKRQGSAGFLKEQAYDYDLNGNRSVDERGGHEFNARDQLVLWNPVAAGKPDVTYRLNGSGGIVERSQGGEVTSYHYLPGDERLDHAITTVGGQSATTNYSYDQGFGDITKYQVVGEPQPAARFVYDAFGRQTHAERRHEGRGLQLRRARPPRYPPGWQQVLRSVLRRLERVAVAGDPVRGRGERRSYDYSSALERIGTARHADGDPGDSPYRAYSLDASGSVEGLQDDTGGDTSRRYFYDPYGNALDAQGDAQEEDQLPAEQQANPFRFEGHYYDAAFKTYDMRARAYLPEIGRFLQEDHYEQALGDQALETDPLTQDRYAFAGGNPTNNIEFDGHRVCNGAHDCGGSSRRASRRNSNFENQKSVFSPREQIEWNQAVNEGAREARGRGPRNRRIAAAAPLRPGHLLPSCTPGACEPDEDYSILGLLSTAGDAAAGVARGAASEATSQVSGLWETARLCNAITNSSLDASANGCGSLPSPSRLARHYFSGDPFEATGRLIVGGGATLLTRRPSLAATKATDDPSNIAQGARLRGDLARGEAASVFDDTGRLHPDVIRNSQRIIPGQNLRNPTVIKELTRDGSNIADWGKYTSRTFRGPSRSFQVHFYRNRATGVINYNIDYKVVFSGKRP